MNDVLQPEAQPEGQAVDEPVISDHQAQMAFETFQSEQNLVMGLLAGLVASVAGAGIWAGVTVVTEYQIGFMAIGIGLLVGYAVQFVGKGIQQSFGIVAAVMSLIGCVLGNVLTITYFVALSEEMAFMDILGQLNFAITVDMLTATFEPVDVLFYALAGYFGYKYAFRKITEDDLNRALGKAI
jgi:hypothetical protein